MRGETMYSLSDIAAATGNGNGGNGNGGFGDGFGAWWVIIFLIFAWGRGGFGGYGNNGNGSNGGGAMDNYVLASDFAQLSRQLDQGIDRIASATTNINNGLCDGFYAINTAFGNLNTNLCTQFGNTNNLITTNGYETRLGLQNLGSQLASCCCDIREGISGVNYNMAMNTNSIQQTLCNNTRDIIESNNANYRALHDEIVANRIEDKNAQITAQQNQITALQLAASQAQQSQYLVEQLSPKCPIPAFLTCNPYTGQTYTNGFGYGNSCGCGNY